MSGDYLPNRGVFSQNERFGRESELKDLTTGMGVALLLRVPRLEGWREAIVDITAQVQVNTGREIVALTANTELADLYREIWNTQEGEDGVRGITIPYRGIYKAIKLSPGSFFP